MAEPDFSVTTPDWLKQGRDVADEWLRMRADNRAQIDQRMRQREQDAMLPLKVREAQQTTELNGLHIQDEFKKRQDLIDAEKAAQALSRGPIADLLKQGDVDGALQAWMEAGVRDPNLRKAKSFGETADDLRFAADLNQRKSLREAQTREATMRAAKEEAQAYEIGLGEGKQFAPDLITKYIKARDLAVREGRTADAAAYQSKIDSEQVHQTQTNTRIRLAASHLGVDQAKLALALKEAGFTVETPTAGPVAPGTAGSVAQGLPALTPTERPLTTGTVTDLQKQNAKLDTSISNVSYAIKQIEAHPEAFGPRGWVGEWAERFQGMVDPDASMTTTGARTTAGEAAHDLIISLKTDPQVSNFERHAIDEVVGKPSEFFTNPARVKAKFQVLLEIAAARRIRQGVALRQLPTMSDLDVITDSEHIKSMAREGTLSNEQALEWARRHLPTK